MSKRRIKLYRGLGDFVPIAVNFSQLENEMDEGGIKKYDPGDGGLEVRRLENGLHYEELVVQILCNLEEREKIIFLFQLLRDSGFQIDHGSCAKAVNLSRRQYMRVLEDVRFKLKLFIIGYEKRVGSHKESI